MKIKCIEAYYDMQLKKNININDVFEVNEARAKQLTTNNNAARRALAVVVEEATTPTTEKVEGAKKGAKKGAKRAVKKDV